MNTITGFAAHIFGEMGFQKSELLDISGVGEIEADIKQAIDDETTDALNDRIGEERALAHDDFALRWYIAEVEKARAALDPWSAKTVVTRMRCGNCGAATSCPGPEAHS